MLDVKIDSKKLSKILKAYDRLHEKEKKNILTRLGIIMAGRVQKDRLSGQVLKVQTGRLRQSIISKVKGDSVKIGTNVKYGVEWETRRGRPFLQPELDSSRDFIYNFVDSRIKKATERMNG